MEYFNDVQRAGLATGVYTCYKCLGEMEFEDKNRSILVCPDCGYSVHIDDYGHEEENESERFPTKEQSLGLDNRDPDVEDHGEYYDPDKDE